MCIRDLRVFAEALDGTLYHYRDKSGLECDAVIHLRDGSYALIEAKLGGSEIEDAARNLVTLHKPASRKLNVLTNSHIIKPAAKLNSKT